MKEAVDVYRLWIRTANTTPASAPAKTQPPMRLFFRRRVVITSPPTCQDTATDAPFFSQEGGDYITTPNKAGCQNRFGVLYIALSHDVQDPCVHESTLLRSCVRGCRLSQERSRSGSSLLNSSGRDI